MGSCVGVICYRCPWNLIREETLFSKLIKTQKEHKRFIVPRFQKEGGTNFGVGVFKIGNIENMGTYRKSFDSYMRLSFPLKFKLLASKQDTILPQVVETFSTIPQTVLALRDSDGVAARWQWLLSDRAQRRSLIFADISGIW